MWLDVFSNTFIVFVFKAKEAKLNHTVLNFACPDVFHILNRVFISLMSHCAYVATLVIQSNSSTIHTLKHNHFNI